MDIQMKHDCMIVKINYKWHKLIDINDSFKKWAKWSGRKNKLPNFNANPKKCEINAYPKIIKNRVLQIMQKS